MESKEQLASSELKLLKITKPIGNHFAAKKAKKLPGWDVSVSDLCRITGIDVTTLSDKVKDRLDRKVKQVCRAGSRMLDDCICVQLYEDGDNLMRWAMNNGAIVVVTPRQIDDLPCIVVDNPVAVYAAMCGYYRRQTNVEVTAVVGSIGKTTTKRMVSSVYAAQYNTFSDPENENQIDCVGYICQHIPSKTEKQVQEISEDTPGCVHFMSEMLTPRIAVVTAIDKSHIESFGNEENIYKEICSITDAMPANGVVITNLDEFDHTKWMAGHKVVTVSLGNTSADYYAKQVKVEVKGLSFAIVSREDGREYPVVLNNVFAMHNIVSALQAFAAGIEAGVSPLNAVNGLSNYKATGIRQNVYDTISGQKLYVDCYNAVARSVRSAIETADKIPVKGKKIAIIGDVEEAGPTSKEIHQEIVRIVDKSQFGSLYTFGPKIQEAVQAVQVRSDLIVKTFLDKPALYKAIKAEKANDNLFLFKASRKSALETCIKAVWPLSFRLKMHDYYWPIIRWRMKVVFN